MGLERSASWRRLLLAGMSAVLVAGVMAGCGSSSDGSTEGVRAGDVTVTPEAIDARLEDELAARGTEAPEVAAGSEAYVALRNEAADDLLRQGLIDQLLADCGAPCAVSATQLDTERARIIATGFDGDEPAFLAALKTAGVTEEEWAAATRRSLGVDRLAAVRADAQPAPTEQELRAYYDDHRTRYGVVGGTAVYAIALDAADKARAERLAQEATPETFEALARKESDDAASAQRGGYLGTIGKSPFNDAVLEAVKEIPIGTVGTTPLELPNGNWLVLHPVAREDAVPAFAKVRAQVEADMRTLAEQRAFEAIAQAIDAAVAEAEYGPGVAPPADTTAAGE